MKKMRIKHLKTIVGKPFPKNFAVVVIVLISFWLIFTSYKGLSLLNLDGQQPGCSFSFWSKLGIMTLHRATALPMKLADSHMPAARQLAGIILNITGINNPEIIQQLNKSMENRDREVGRLLQYLQQSESRSACYSGEKSRSHPVTALDPRIRLNYNETWNGLRLPVITFETRGRLGNIMCEYSAVLALHKIYNVSAVVSRRFSKEIQKYFKSISLPVVEVKHGWKIVGRDSMKNYTFHAAQLAAAGLLGPKPFMIKDYLVELSLVNGFRTEILQEFTFQDRILQKATARLQNFTSIAQRDKEHKQLVTVGIHVRLTDYPNHMHGVYATENIVGLYEKYLRRAADYFLIRYANVVFVATSDSAKQAEEIFNKISLENVFVSQETIGEDMCLLTLCDHNIITLGSFGFWIGYMGRGTTVYPEISFKERQYPFSKYFYEKAQIKHFVPIIF